MTSNLYGLTRSVYTRIARLSLEEKGVPYTLHEVEIFGPAGVPPEHLARHPFGRLPVLEHDGFSIYETTAIARYVDEAFPGPSLQPGEPKARARMNQIVSVLDSYAYRPMVWGVFVERVGKPRSGKSANEGMVTESVTAAGKCLSALGAIVECEPFLVTPHLTLADLHAFPMLRYLSLAPEGRELIASHHRLDRWLAMMVLRASVVRTKSAFEE